MCVCLFLPAVYLMALLVQPSKAGHPQAADDITGKPRWALHGHDEEVLALTSRGDVFASSSADGVCLMWLITSDGAIENVCKMSSRGPAVVDMKFLDAQTLVCAQGDGCVKLWHVERGAVVDSISRGTVRGRNPWPVVNSVTVSSEEQFFFGGDDGYLAHCDRRQGTVRTSWSNMKVPVTASCCTDESLFVGDVCGSVHWFDLRMTGAPVDCLKASQGVITSLIPDARGERLAVLSLDSTLRLLDIQPFAASHAERCLATVPVSQSAERQHLLRADWSWENDVIAIPAAEGSVHCIAASRSTGEVVRRVDAAKDDATNVVNGVRFVGKSHMLIGGTTSLLLHTL